MCTFVHSGATLPTPSPHPRPPPTLSPTPPTLPPSPPTSPLPGTVVFLTAEKHPGNFAALSASPADATVAANKLCTDAATASLLPVLGNTTGHYYVALLWCVLDAFLSLFVFFTCSVLSASMHCPRAVSIITGRRTPLSIHPFTCNHPHPGGVSMGSS